MYRKCLLLCAAVAVFATATPSFATPLTISQPLTPTTGAGPVVTGAASALNTQAVTGVNTLDHSTAFTGTLYNQVFYTAPDAIAPYVHLTFAYQYVANAGSADSVLLFTTQNFATYKGAGAVVNADYYTVSGVQTTPSLPGDNGMDLPVYVDRGGLLGSRIDFNFTTGIAPGQTSHVFFVETAATSYDFKGGTLIQDGGQAIVPTYEPTPEPASLVLLGGAFAGLAGAAGLRRWRKPVAAA